MNDRNKPLILVAAFALLAGTTAVPTSAQPTKSYKNPQTGSDCVTEAGSEYSSSGSYVYVKFRNTCDVLFSVWGQARSGRKWSTGVSPYGTTQHTIPAADFDGFEWWVE